MTMLDDTQGWKARVTESPADFARDTRRLMVAEDAALGATPALNLLFADGPNVHVDEEWTP